VKQLLLNHDSGGGLPPAAKAAVTGETDLEKVKPTPTPEPTPKPTPAAPVVKDEKWLDTEINVAEDKLRTLREQKAVSGGKPAPSPDKKKTGWECDDL